MSLKYSEISSFFTAKKNEASVLLVNSSEAVIPIIKNIMSDAKIYEMTGEVCEDNHIIFKVKESSLKYTNEFTKNSFDYVVFTEVTVSLETAMNFFMVFHSYLKDDGEIIASFKNKHHWSNLEKTAEGWQYKAETGKQCEEVSFSEINKMFEQTRYREVHFDASYNNAAASLTEILIGDGFSNENEELNVLRWGVSASKSNKKAFQLRQLFTKEIRENMVFLLRRIENEIDSDENCRRIFSICQENGVSYLYLVDLSYNALIYPDKVIYLLAIYLYENKYEHDSIEVLMAAYKIRPEQDLIVYALASFFCLQKQYEAAVELLSEYKGQDADVLHLQEQLRG
jgi:hypothetical protein